MSVSGTGGHGNTYRIFSIQYLKNPLQPKPPRHLETVTFNRRPFSYHMSSVSLTIAGAGILNLLSIDYASRPRLRSRLTLGGRTLPRKPWFYGGQEFTLACRYSCLHPHLLELHLAFPHGFNAPTMLSYHACPANRSCIQSFGIPLIANHFRRKIAR